MPQTASDNSAGKPLRLPLLLVPSNRDETTNRDARLVNGYIEVMSKELYVVKRPGLNPYYTQTAAAGLGVFNWQGDIYSIVGNTMYKNNAALTGTVNTSARYTFSSCLGATPKLFFHNGTKAYTYTTAGGIVEVTDVDYPTATVGGSAYLDGTMYVMQAKANIQGSAINDPTSWDALNSLIAQIEPDAGVFLAKQLVYVIAFKQWSTEVFYDAGNATGSPLGAVQGAKVNVGCRSGGSIQDIEGTLLWIGQARSGSVNVMLMDGVKAEAVSTPAIDRLLEEGDYTIVYSWTAKMAGHKFYGVTLKNNNLTLVYDLTSKQWYQWTDANGNYFPIVSSTFDGNQRPVLQHESNGKVYTLEATQFNDDGVLFPVDLYTPNFDGETRLKKYLHSMDFVADRMTGSILSIRVSDDDYQTWSNFREVDLGMPRPRLTGCGSFRRRAFHMRHFKNVFFRMRAIELQVSLGTL